MTRPKLAAVVALVAAGSLAACTSAGGSAPTVAPTGPTPVTSFAQVAGTTTLHLDAGLARALYTHGIDTVATGDARVPGRGTAVLAITSGSLTLYKSPAKARISLQHDDGGLRVSADAGSVRIENFALHLGTKPAITVQLMTSKNGTNGQAQPVTLFQLEPTTSFRPTAKHGVATVSGLRLYLTPQAIKIFDHTLRSSAFGHLEHRFAGTLTAKIRKS